MTFGAASSPCSAHYVKNWNATHFGESTPEAVKAIHERHYMDDYLDSAHTITSAKKQVTDVINLHKMGGFEIRSWISSHKEVLCDLPEDLLAPSKAVTWEEKTKTERILGMRWDPWVDCFTYVVNPDCKQIAFSKRNPTKREVLRLVMSLFDPLGLLSHYIVKAKILLQDVWRTGQGWDDELSGLPLKKWETWVTQLANIENLKIRRCYSPEMMTATQLQLHLFCDASEQAFSAVAYIRTTSESSIEISLVAAKSRVSPLKPVSIPRLELQAAVLAARLAETIKGHHDIKIHSTIFWTDSKTVLCWLRSDARNFKPFVSHRIGEILDLTDVSDWRWIPTKENVADDATRDLHPTDLRSDNRWFTGPEFLYFPEAQWPLEAPTTTEIQTDDLEMKRDFTGVITDEPCPIDPKKFSKYLRLLRSVAWVQRFIHNSRNPNKKRIHVLKYEELLAAEETLMRWSQTDTFKEEKRLLLAQKQIPLTSRLSQLSPFMDTDGLIRIRGRLANSSTVLQQTKTPIILDPKHHVTKLLIQFYHERSNHHGQEHVLNELRQRFWILDGRAAVRSIRNSCQVCKNQRSKPYQPEMAALPDCRLNYKIRPFTSTGIDYFGPYQVRIGRRTEKRYGVIFTCLSTRAIHLELAHDLSTDSCLLALRRMVSRKGHPTEIITDNGTNFRGAATELKHAINELNHFKIETELALKSIKWRFNPPGAPHMGGCWERLIRSVKKALTSTLKEKSPKEEVLLTLLVEAEGVVNSRPLTHVSLDHKDSEALTPNHFLLGTSSPNNLPGVFKTGDLHRKKQWRISQKLADNFWTRWLREYLPTLTRRTKWTQPSRPVKIGDVVIVVDATLSRNVWPRGIVKRLHPGKDGIIRVVDVETNMGTFRRPVSKICILDVHKVDGIGSTDGGENVPDQTND